MMELPQKNRTKENSNSLSHHTQLVTLVQCNVLVTACFTALQSGGRWKWRTMKSYVLVLAVIALLSLVCPSDAR